MKKLLDLFLTFFKIGAFTFGGGYAMIALIEEEVVTNKGWITTEEILDIIAIAETTPGPISVNASTYIGYKVGGIKGSVLATLGVILPSFVIISVLSIFITKFKENKIVDLIFKGIRSGIIVLIFNAAFRLTKKVPKEIFTYSILVLIIVSTLIFKVNVILMLIISAILGILYGLIITNKKISKHNSEGNINDN